MIKDQSSPLWLGHSVWAVGEQRIEKPGTKFYRVMKTMDSVEIIGRKERLWVTIAGTLGFLFRNGILKEVSAVTWSEVVSMGQGICNGDGQ